MLHGKAKQLSLLSALLVSHSLGMRLGQPDFGSLQGKLLSVHFDLAAPVEALVVLPHSFDYDLFYLVPGLSRFRRSPRTVYRT